MATHSGDEALAFAFLMDRLAGQEREDLEARLFADEEFFALLQACQEELIRDYLNNRLAPGDAADFRRKYFASDALRAKVEFASSVMAAVKRGGDAAAAKPRAARFAAWFENWQLNFALACLALAAVGAGLFREEWRVRRLDAQLNSLRHAQTSPEQARVKDSAPRLLTSFVLLPIGSRDPSQPQRVLQIPAGDGVVEMTLGSLHYPKSTNFRAAITTAEGTELWSAIVAADRVKDGALTLTLPARIFGNADYVALLDGTDNASAHESYPIRTHRN